ncbi:hypothetical protein DTO013E5_3706 [Penicillium roqueforti]|nr:hypothetical protein DTO012A1_8893 [Penicillium roqueforti]KAI2752411.1 hypothetical protein DTO013F2_3214 [Penicillium roqueforti]KAI3213793.1 hypothetical protein DTO013E5_3706 [Penicillium roqueforti]
MLQYSSPRSTYLFPNEVPNWRQEQDATITDSLEVAVGFLLIGYNNVFCVVVENSQFSFFTILPYHGSHRHWSPSLGGSCVPHTSRPKLLFLKYMGAETVSNAVVSKADNFPTSFTDYVAPIEQQWLSSDCRCQYNINRVKAPRLRPAMAVVPHAVGTGRARILALNPGFRTLVGGGPCCIGAGDWFAISRSPCSTGI